jgi:hypothetical protein
LAENINNVPVWKKCSCFLLFKNHKRSNRETNEATPWSKVLLEKLVIPQLVKKFAAFYGTRRFITELTEARHWPCFETFHSLPPFSSGLILMLFKTTKYVLLIGTIYNHIRGSHSAVTEVLSLWDIAPYRLV